MIENGTFSWEKSCESSITLKRYVLCDFHMYSLTVFTSVVTIVANYRKIVAESSKSAKIDSKFCDRLSLNIPEIFLLSGTGLTFINSKGRHSIMAVLKWRVKLLISN